MKLIFLDVDGVLNSSEDWIEYSVFKHPHNHGSEVISRTKIALLFTLLRATGAKIVWSSTWRNHYSLDELHKLLDDRIGPESENRIPRDTFVGKTPKFYGGYRDRSREVEAWLKEHGKDVTHWVAIDDVDAGFTVNGLSDHFVKTNPAVGLTFKDVYDACVLLEGDDRNLPRVLL